MADGSDEDYTLEAYEDDEFDDDDYTETVINAPAPAPSTAAASRSGGSLAAGASLFAASGGSDALPRSAAAAVAPGLADGEDTAAALARAREKNRALSESLGLAYDPSRPAALPVTSFAPAAAPTATATASSAAAPATEPPPPRKPRRLTFEDPPASDAASPLRAVRPTSAALISHHLG